MSPRFQGRKAPRDARRPGRGPALAVASALALGGCATWSEDGGFSTVQATARQELRADAAAIRTPQQAATAQARVRALLARPLTADAAVQIALLNNRGLQAAYGELGLTEVSLVESTLPPSPTLSVGRVASGAGTVEVERQIVVNILGLATLPQRRAIARDRFRQAQLQAALATLQAAADARRGFYQAAAAHQTVHLLEQEQQSAAAGVEVVTELGRTGGAARIDQARERAFFAEVTAQLAQARLRHDRQTEALVRALGVWGGDVERLREPSRLPPLPPRAMAQADVEAEALRRRVDLQIARLELVALARSMGLERATRYVDLVELIGISAREREELIVDGERVVERDDLGGVELEFQVPLFDFGQARARGARALPAGRPPPRRPRGERALAGARGLPRAARDPRHRPALPERGRAAARDRHRGGRAALQQHERRHRRPADRRPRGDPVERRRHRGAAGLLARGGGPRHGAGRRRAGRRR